LITASDDSIAKVHVLYSAVCFECLVAIYAVL
jgi:hypothetical protein